MQNVPYASVVGSIMYAVRCTRPDVAFAQNITSRFQQNPSEPHWTAVKTILNYLRNTKDMFLVYGENLEAELRATCYCDAGFETDRVDIKSQTAYVFVLHGGGKAPSKDVSAIVTENDDLSAYRVPDRLYRNAVEEEEGVRKNRLIGERDLRIN
ncbi:hypothetical protein Tco_1505352 [Tanacetum coccineum]